MPRRTGRPSKFEPERCARFIAATRLGAFRALAAAAAGWSEPTAYAYLAHGADAREMAEKGHHLDARQQEFAEFSEMVHRAEAEMCQAALASIIRAAQRGEWRAAGWLLEHRFPSEYGRRTVEVTGPSGGPVEVEFEVSVDEVMAAFERFDQGA